jgi:D-alanyl-D-alanine carboxypeptidase
LPLIAVAVYRRTWLRFFYLGANLFAMPQYPCLSSKGGFTLQRRIFNFAQLFTAYCLLTLACRPSQSVLLQNELQTQLDSLQQASDITGISVAVIGPDEKNLAVTSGLADKEDGEALKPSHRLLMGSVGKMYVAALVLQEVAAGKLSLDDSVKQFLAGTDWYAPLANADKITLRQLLNHTSGLERWVFKPQVWQSMLADPDKVWSMADRMAMIRGDSAIHAPGEGWAYSDTNYLLLGVILEQLNGQSFYELVEARLLQPHGLQDTQPSDQRELAGLADGYTGERNPFGFPVQAADEGIYAVNPQFEWTGGGFMTTPSELARFARLLYEGDLISPEMQEQMRTAAPFATPLPGNARYGLACMMRDTPLGQSLGHEGFMPGFQTVVDHFPEKGITIALMVNEDQFGGHHSSPLHEWGLLLAKAAAQRINAAG